MNTQPSEMQTSRGRFFFWIGLIILPVFWVWWMRAEYFSRTQRRAGWMWTVCYLGTLILCKDLVGERLQALIFSYSTVSLQLGAVLWLWLLFRVFSFKQLVFLYLVSVDVIAMLASLWVPALSRMEPSPTCWIFPLIPAVLHLLVEPVHRWRKKIDPDTVKTMRKRLRILMYSLIILLLGCWSVWLYREFRDGRRVRTPSTSSAEPQTEPKFPDRVQALLDSEWTEVSITTALCTDYVIVYATTVRLKRETPKSPVYYSLPLGQAAPEKATVDERDLKTLFTDTVAAAKATFDHKYPIEILNSLPPEKAKEMIRSGALKIGPNDVEMLSIRGKTAAAEVRLIEYGPFSPLDTTIQTLFHTKQMEVKPSEHKAILGLDPYAEE